MPACGGGKEAAGSSSSPVTAAAAAGREAGSSAARDASPERQEWVQSSQPAEPQPAAQQVGDDELVSDGSPSETFHIRRLSDGSDKPPPRRVGGSVLTAALADADGGRAAMSHSDVKMPTPPGGWRDPCYSSDDDPPSSSSDDDDDEELSSAGSGRIEQLPERSQWRLRAALAAAPVQFVAVGGSARRRSFDRLADTLQRDRSSLSPNFLERERSNSEGSAQSSKSPPVVRRAAAAPTALAEARHAGADSRGPAARSCSTSAAIASTCSTLSSQAASGWGSERASR